MITEEAREYFLNKGLTYKKINQESLDVLAEKLIVNLEKYKLEGGFHAEQMGMKLRKRTKFDKKFSKDGLVRARFYIDSSYFHKREGITFHEGGFIGFAGEFSTVNTQPILNAFVEWCDYLENSIMEIEAEKSNKEYGEQAEKDYIKQLEEEYLVQNL